MLLTSLGSSRPAPSSYICNVDGCGKVFDSFADCQKHLLPQYVHVSNNLYPFLIINVTSQDLVAEKRETNFASADKSTKLNQMTNTFLGSHLCCLYHPVIQSSGLKVWVKCGAIFYDKENIFRHKRFAHGGHRQQLSSNPFRITKPRQNKRLSSIWEMATHFVAYCLAVTFEQALPCLMVPTGLDVPRTRSSPYKFDLTFSISRLEHYRNLLMMYFLGRDLVLYVTHWPNLAFPPFSFRFKY